MIRDNEHYRQDHNQVIELLADCYPKAFFVNPRMRVPLKNRVDKDIDPKEITYAAGHPVDVYGAVRWYQSHFGYLLQLQTGASRIDLHGNPCGTVTSDEAIAATQFIKETHNRINERKAAMRNGNGNGNGLPTFVTKRPVTFGTKLPGGTMNKVTPPAIAKLESAPVSTKVEPAPGVAIEDERQKQLKVAIKRIEFALSNLETDGEMAASILRSASRAVEQVIDKLGA
jgi:hypothetical protein